jgi:septal ring factor EnvC (AmiA/AmiB activator)
VLQVIDHEKSRLLPGERLTVQCYSFDETVSPDVGLIAIRSETDEEFEARIKYLQQQVEELRQRDLTNLDQQIASAERSLQELREKKLKAIQAQETQEHPSE